MGTFLVEWAVAREATRPVIFKTVPQDEDPSTRPASLPNAPLDSHVSDSAYHYLSPESYSFSCKHVSLGGVLLTYTEFARNVTTMQIKWKLCLFSDLSWSALLCIQVWLYPWAYLLNYIYKLLLFFLVLPSGIILTFNIFFICCVQAIRAINFILG